MIIHQNMLNLHKEKNYGFHHKTRKVSERFFFKISFITFTSITINKIKYYEKNIISYSDSIFRC